jgi:hypothetical protein
MNSHEEFEKVKGELVAALPSEIEGPWQMSMLIGIIMAAYNVESPQEASLVCVQAASDYCDFLVRAGARNAPAQTGSFTND